MKNKDLTDRFWAKVDKSAGPDACWPWKSSKNGDGYGLIRTDRTRSAHRVAWELTFGPIPDGMCVCHTCDIRACINPVHLFLGTVADNDHNRDQKKRQGYGERNGRAKLTEVQVAELRQLYAVGLSLNKLANKFTVKKSTVCDVINGKHWKHLPILRRGIGIARPTLPQEQSA